MNQSVETTISPNEMSIVYLPGGSPYVLVVLASGIADEKVADQAIAEISRVVWEGRQATDGKRRTRK